MSYHKQCTSQKAKKSIKSLISCEKQLNQNYQKHLLEAAKQTQDNWRGQLQKAIIRNINQSLSKSCVRQTLQLRTICESNLD